MGNQGGKLSIQTLFIAEQNGKIFGAISWVIDIPFEFITKADVVNSDVNFKNFDALFGGV